MNIEQAIEVLKEYSKWLNGDKAELQSQIVIRGALDMVSSELQNMLNNIQPTWHGGKLTNEDNKEFQPKDGDFVKLISGKREYEAIFKCLNNNQIWHYAIVNLRYDWSWLSTDWSSNKFDILSSDGSYILEALKKAGKRWNAEKKCIEDDDTPNIGDKCIFWNDDSGDVRIGRLEYIEEICRVSSNIKPYMFKSGGVYFQNCIKYSDNKLIEIANKL